MTDLLNALRMDMLDPRHIIGAAVWAVVFLIVAMVLSTADQRFG